MTPLGWKLARLSAMSPAEVAHRARIVLRDRFAPPAYASWSPAQAGPRLYDGGAARALASSLLPRWPRALEPAEDFAPAVGAGRGLLDGRWSLFGCQVRLDDPPVWNRNPVSGAAWPEAASGALDYRRSDIAGGAKGGQTFCDNLQTAWIATSLGGVHTLVGHAASTTHRQMDEAARLRAGISDGLVRVSIGLEDPEDLLEDFTRALEAV